MVSITKADGSSEPFQIEKLKRSLRRSGASSSEVTAIGNQISAEITDGMGTQEIYQRAFALLRASAEPVAARYSLRRALFELGPTGFPFEDFLVKLFTAEGYTAKARVALQGKCAPHEIDIAAYKDDHAFVAEAKFHARPGIKSDLQVAMYSYARKLDLAGQRICQQDMCGVKDFMLITNTKFTTTAEAYANCVGVSLLSWDFPRHNNLHDRIQRANIYPITVLQSLSVGHQRSLLERGIVICRDLVENPQVLRHLHIGVKKTEAVLSEARQLCTAT